MENRTRGTSFPWRSEGGKHVGHVGRKKCGARASGDVPPRLSSLPKLPPSRWPAGRLRACGGTYAGLPLHAWKGRGAVVSGASGAEASAGDCDRCRCRCRETYPLEGAAAGALEPPPPPDMGGGRSPESSAQLLDMCDVCVEQSPRSGRCVRGSAGAAPGAGNTSDRREKEIGIANFRRSKG